MDDLFGKPRVDNTAILSRQTFANLWTGFSFGFGAILPGVPAWKATVVFVFALISCVSRLHRTEIRAAGLIFLAVAPGCWTEVLPG